MTRPTGNRTDRQHAGTLAEQWARRHLEQHGMRLVDQNYRCKLGELDLIMLQRSTLVFVEVRKRVSARYGGAIESITPHKQQRLLRAAEYYLLVHPQWRHHPCRFDVITVSGQDNRIEWIQNAIQA